MVQFVWFSMDGRGRFGGKWYCCSCYGGSILLGSVCIVGGYLLWSGGVVQVVRLVEKVFGGGNC